MIRLFVALAALAGLLLAAAPAPAQSCGTVGAGYNRAAAVRSYGTYGYAAPAAAVYVQPYQPQTTYTYSSYYQALAVPVYSVTYQPDGAQSQIDRLKTELELKSLKIELQALQLKQAQQQPPAPPVPPEQQPYEPQTGPPELGPPPPAQPRPQPRQRPMPPADQQQPQQPVPTSYLQPRRIVATAAAVQQQRQQPHYGLRQACAGCHDAATKAKGGGLALFDRGRPVMSAQQQLASIRAITEGRMPLRGKLTPGQRVALVGELGQSVAVNR